MRKILGLVLISAVVSGCASGSDPYTIFSNSQGTPTIGLPVAVESISSPGVVPTAEGNGIQLSVIGVGGAVNINVVSPFDGYVSAISLESTGYSITIFYNSEFSVRVSELTNLPLVDPGERVLAQEAIAYVPTTATVTYTVLKNNVATCPYAFLDTTSQNAVKSRYLAGGGIHAPCL